MNLPSPSFVKRFKLAYASTLYAKRTKEHVLQQLFWECTLRCNLNCIHCGSDCRTISEKQDMPLDDFLVVLDDVRSKMNPDGILVITTGGEPLVRKDICECGKAIRERGFHWGMVSNGMLLDEKMCTRLMDASLETIAISLDGYEDAHNWLRGNPNSFCMAERAIKTLVGKRITWDVITCVNQKNYSQLKEFRQYLINMGVKQWRIFTIAPMGRATGNSELQLTNQQFIGVMDFIVETRKEGKIHLSYGCEGFLGNYEWQVRDYPYFCQAGINVASVLSDGEISGCLSIRSNYHQGNIYKEKFTDVWEHRFTPYRNHEWMHTGICYDCKMWDFCLGNGMHLRDDDGSLLLCHYKSEKINKSLII